MLNARLSELTKKADPPFFMGFSGTYSFVKPVDLTQQGALVDKDGIEKGLAALVREVERVERHGFTPGEMARAQARMLSRVDAQLKEKDKTPSSAFADELVKHFLADEAAPGIVVEHQLQHEILPTITADDVNTMAASWMGDKNQVLIGSAPEGAKLPSPAQAVGVFSAVKSESIEAYTDDVKSGPLFAGELTPAKIVSEKDLAKV